MNAITRGKAARALRRVVLVAESNDLAEKWVSSGGKKKGLGSPLRCKSWDNCHGFSQWFVMVNQ